MHRRDPYPRRSAHRRESARTSFFPTGKSKKEKPKSNAPFGRAEDSSDLQNENIWMQDCATLRRGRFPAARAEAPWRKNCGSTALGGSLKNGLNSCEQGNGSGRAIGATFGGHNHHGVALLQVRQGSGRDTANHLLQIASAAAGPAHSASAAGRRVARWWTV